MSRVLLIIPLEENAGFIRLYLHSETDILVSWNLMNQNFTSMFV